MSAVPMMAALYGLAFSNIFLRSSMGVLAPELAAELDLSAAMLGAIASSYFISYALMQIPTGIALDRFGPRRTITTLYLLTVLGSALFALAEDGLAMLLARLLMGAGCAGIFAAAFMIIGRFYPAERFTSIGGALNSFAMVGTLAATVPLATLVVAFGWRLSFAGIVALMGAIAVLALITVHDHPRGDGPPATPCERESAAELLKGLWQVMGTPGVLPLASAGIALSAGNTLLGIWGGPYLNDVHGLDEIGRGTTLSAMAIAGVFGHFLFGYVARWFNTLKGVVVASSICIVLIMSTLALLRAPDLLLVTALLAALGLACSFPTILLAHARLLVPEHQVGRGITAVNTGIMISIALMQIAVGTVVELASPDGAVATGIRATEETYRTAFGFIAIMAVLSLLLYSRVADRRPAG